MLFLCKIGHVCGTESDMFGRVWHRNGIRLVFGFSSWIWRHNIIGHVCGTGPISESFIYIYKWSCDQSKRAWRWRNVNCWDFMGLRARIHWWWRRLITVRVLMWPPNAKFHCDVKLSQTCPIRSHKRARFYKETRLSFHLMHVNNSGVFQCYYVYYTIKP